MKSAYDWIPRDALLKVIQFRTGASKIVNIIRESFRNTEAKIKGSKDKFATASGLKQGSLDSPPYFNIYFDFCIEVAKHQIKHKNLCHKIKMKYQIPLECVGKREERATGDTRGVIKIEEEEYADDLVCITGSTEEAKVTTEVYNATFARFGLTIARDKTETMAFNFDESTKTKETLFSIDGTPIKNVQIFKYLGYHISNTIENDNIDVQSRISLAENKFQEMKQLLCDRELPIKQRSTKFLQTFVRSRLCYSVQAWDLKEHELKRIESKWTGFLRRMVNGGLARKVDSMAYRYSNQDIIRITETTPIRKHIQQQQLKYLAHVCRMPNSDIRKQVLFAENTTRSNSIWQRWEKVLNIDKSQLRKIMMDRKKFFDFVTKINL